LVNQFTLEPVLVQLFIIGLKENQTNLNVTGILLQNMIRHNVYRLLISPTEYRF